jgi:hypothetical protein
LIASILLKGRFAPRYPKASGVPQNDSIFLKYDFRRVGWKTCTGEELPAARFARH